jgi:potassium efflux system protein
MPLIWLGHAVFLIFCLGGVDVSHAAAAHTTQPLVESEGNSGVASASTAEQIQAKLAALTANRDIPDEERKQAQDFYQQALSQLQAAKNYADHAVEFQQTQQSASAEIARLHQKIESESATPPLPAHQTVPELSERLAQLQMTFSSTQEQLSSLDQQVSVQQVRPKTLSSDLETLRQQAADLENKLRTSATTGTSPLLIEARQIVLAAQQQALNQQVAALEQERLSYDARLNLLNARRAVTAQEVTQARTRIQELQDELNNRRRDEAAAVVQQTAQVKQEVATKPPIIQSLADDNAATSRRLEDVVRQGEAVNAEQARLSEQLARLMERLLGVRQQLSIAGSSDALGPILLEERRNLPDIRRYQRSEGELQQRIIQSRLDQYRTTEALNQARDSQAVKKMTDQFETQWSDTERQTIIEELRPLLAGRQELLKKLNDSYGNLLTALVALDDVQGKLAEQTTLYRDLLDRHLLWIRSGTVLGAEWLRNLGLTVNWLLQPRHWQEVWQNLQRGITNQPVLAALSGLLFLVLLSYRRPLIRRLGESVTAIGDVRQDRFAITARALVMTVLLALPWPWLLASVGRLLYLSGNAAEFSQGLMQGLFGSAAIAMNITLLRQCCRPRGVAIAHFGWTEAGCRFVRRHLYWFVWVGAISVLIVKLCEVQTEPVYGDSLGRLVFFIGMLALAALLWRVLDPNRPLMSAVAENYANTMLWRMRYFWYWAIAGGYLSLGLLALSGYYYTALQLRGRLMLTAWLLLAILLLLNLFLRWLNISQRRLALQRAMAKREAQLAARATKDSSATPAGESVPIDLLQVPDLDLTTISEQTRSIMMLLVWVGLGLGLWQIWEGLIPAFAILNEITLWQHTTASVNGAQIVDITLGRVLVAGVLLLLAGLMAHNLPGVLELVVLRRLTVDSGNRNALITIVRYLIVGIGLVIALNVIGMNWERVQWLVAALGVGLGFGLQEIFANFVSGLILLLERPIRVGDTVTLGDQSGTVARIHIRATTLIDWDRKEIIVPNKTFITSALINWTRNDSITRVVIPVSVSYDSDPIQVHKILLEVAATHPWVLKDPAPAVLFLKLGESALEFEVRVFVQELANRLALIHELHNQVFEALRANHIVIPFPQRDVHLYGWLGQLSHCVSPTIANPKDSTNVDFC